MGKVRVRIFNIMQYEKHPETGEILLTEEKIKDALAHRTIKRWAYIAHEQDVYSALDEENNSKHVKGNVKPKHWHIVLEMNSATEIGSIAKWFGIADNFVNIAKGAGAFLDCVTYLTHEDNKQRELGKYRYPDENVIANFEWRAELDKRAERKLKYGRDLDIKEQLRYDVMYNGMPLSRVAREHELEYMEDFTYLQKCRADYLKRRAEVPPMRVNIYVEGDSGIGKGLIAKAIARSFVDRDGVLADNEIFYEVGAKKTTFDAYDGQPVVLWNDCRAYELLELLGGRGNVFDVFDTTPSDREQNKKYGSVRLINCVNIVNSVQPWKEFLDGLAGEYTDKNGNIVVAEHNQKSQSYRRFPLFLVLREEDYDLGINKGFFEGTREFEQFEMYKNIRSGVRKIRSRCGNNTALYNLVTGKVVAPVVEKLDEAKTVLYHEQQGTDEEILAEFSDVGTRPVQQTLFDEDKKEG